MSLCSRKAVSQRRLCLSLKVELLPAYLEDKITFSIAFQINSLANKNNLIQSFRLFLLSDCCTTVHDITAVHEWEAIYLCGMLWLTDRVNHVRFPCVGKNKCKLGFHRVTNQHSLPCNCTVNKCSIILLFRAQVYSCAAQECEKQIERHTCSIVPIHESVCRVSHINRQIHTCDTARAFILNLNSKESHLCCFYLLLSSVPHAAGWCNDAAN